MSRKPLWRQNATLKIGANVRTVVEAPSRALRQDRRRPAESEAAAPNLLVELGVAWAEWGFRQCADGANLEVALARARAIIAGQEP